MNIFITGVSSGIGWGLAKYYLSAGYTVYGASRRVPETLIKSPDFHHLSIDLSQFDQCQSALVLFFQQITSLDLVILNAGVIGEIAQMKDQSIEKMQQVLDINVWANKPIIDTALCCIKRVDKVVAISSGAAVNGSKGWGGYSISKAALNMLIKLYAAESEHTQFYAFAPGLVDTAMQDYLCGGHVDKTQFPSVQKLLDARKTPSMPKAEAAATKLAWGIDQLDNLPTGSYADIRTMSLS